MSAVTASQPLYIYQTSNSSWKVSLTRDDTLRERLCIFLPRVPSPVLTPSADDPSLVQVSTIPPLPRTMQRFQAISRAEAPYDTLAVKPVTTPAQFTTPSAETWVAWTAEFSDCVPVVLETNILDATQQSPATAMLSLFRVYLFDPKMDANFDAFYKRVLYLPDTLAMTQRILIYGAKEGFMGYEANHGVCFPMKKNSSLNWPACVAATTGIVGTERTKSWLGALRALPSAPTRSVPMHYNRDILQARLDAAPESNHWMTSIVAMGMCLSLSLYYLMNGI